MVPPKKSHPKPPPDLHARSLPLRSIRTAWFRIHDLIYDPIFFGRTGNQRFDAPHPRKYGVLYVGEEVDCAFIETLGHETGKNVIAEAELLSRGLARVSLKGFLRLVDLTAEGLAQIGADNHLCTGPIAVSQRWSGALYRHPEQPDGICFRSRHNPELLCAAIFDRVAPRVRATLLGCLRAPKNMRRITPLLTKYGFSLVP
jgi:hypothetical protein